MATPDGNVCCQVRGRRERASNFPLLDDSLVSMIINDAQARLVTSTASPQTSRQSSQNSANRLRVVPMNRVSFEPNLPRMSNRSGHLLNYTLLIVYNQGPLSKMCFQQMLIQGLRQRGPFRAQCQLKMTFKGPIWR